MALVQVHPKGDNDIRKDAPEEALDVRALTTTTARVTTTTTTTTTRRSTWRNDVLGCLDSYPLPCLMSFCCMGVFMGQVFQRLKYNLLGRPTVTDPQNSNGSTTSKRTCAMLSSIYIFGLIMALVVGVATFPLSGMAGFLFVGLVLYAFLVVVLAQGRHNYRLKRGIPNTNYICCPTTKNSNTNTGNSNDNVINITEDCCCSAFCGCCTLLQLHRDTHDEEKYPYEILSATGLPLNAPEIHGV